MIHKSFNCNLNQLTSFSRGVLSDANSDGLFDTVASSSRTQAWNLDALGNWANLTTNSTSQSRTHNAQNQVTGVGSTSLSYDANGSMTADESGRVFVYDAWNRQVAVRNTANSPIVGYSYDALGRRIIEDRPNANTVDHLYYSTSWQVLEERRDGTSTGDVRRQYFWGIDYVDALTARVDYASGAVSATYYAQYDANWNITAIVDATSGVLERYIYDPYGTATVLYANWTVRGGSPYGWNYLHQGGRFDVDSNLHNFRHRDYSATLGRWTQNDTIGFESGDLNLYRYVENSPINALDPDGYRIWVDLGRGWRYGIDFGENMIKTGGFEIHVYEHNVEVAKLTGYGGFCRSHGTRQLPAKSAAEFAQLYGKEKLDRLRQEVILRSRIAKNAGWSKGLGKGRKIGVIGPATGLGITTILISFAISGYTDAIEIASEENSGYQKCLKALARGDMPDAQKQADEFYLDLLTDGPGLGPATRWKRAWDNAVRDALDHEQDSTVQKVQ